MNPDFLQPLIYGFDGASDTVMSFTPSGTYPGFSAYAGAVLLKDGRVFCVPRNSSSARIYGDALGANLPDARVLSAYDNKF